MEIHKQLIKLRREKGLSVIAASELADVADHSIRAWESGLTGGHYQKINKYLKIYNKKLEINEL